MGVATGAVGAARGAAEAAEAVKGGVDVFGNASTETFVSVRAIHKLHQSLILQWHFPTLGYCS